MNRIPLFVLLALFLASPAHAHKVNMFAFVEGDRVVVNGYFSDGHKALNSKVEVFSPDGKKLVEGMTDAEGSFGFKIPQDSDLKITLYAGMGHRTQYTLPRSELSGAGGAASSSSAEAMAATTDGAATDSGEGASSEASDAAAVVAPSELEGVVRKAVGEAIMPIARELSELKEARSFSDIIGGIGFIIGLIGVFFYMKARKELARSGKAI